MDCIILVAIEEVCARAAAGIPVVELWPSLRGALSGAGLPPCDAIYKVIWVRLLAHPGLRFEAHGSPLGSQDPSIQSLEEAQRIGVRIVAEDHLRDSFLGIYDLKASSSDISQIQRAALERLAAARIKLNNCLLRYSKHLNYDVAFNLTNGVTQSELGKEFGIKGNNLFYIVKHLESQHLIVRQSTIVRAKDSGTEWENAAKNNSVVSTNLLHLHRYAKNLNLNSQQRFEITRADILEGMTVDGSSLNGDEISGDFAKDDVSIKDYLPAMKAICDKLEEASGKVSVVSDIKMSLGYRKTAGHRAWRNVVSCLRLLKKFDSRDFQPKKGMHSHDNFDNENLIKIGKRGHMTDQFVELPLEHRIYDMVDSEGQKGLTISEVGKVRRATRSFGNTERDVGGHDRMQKQQMKVCRRLGFTPKKLYSRISSMRERFRMCWQAEIHEKTPLYRMWTFRNYPHHTVNTLPGKHEALQGTNDLLFQSKNLTLLELQLINSCSTGELSPIEKTDCAVGLAPSGIPPEHDRDAQEIKCRRDHQNNTTELPSVSYDSKPAIVEIMLKQNACQREEGHFVSSVSPEVKAVKRHHSLSTSNRTRREERIVKKLKKEELILTAELYRWLEELEKGKSTKMGRRTLTSTLNKLQKEGLCKCVQVSFPVVTNFNRHRITDVILHPSVDNLSPELLDKIYRRQREFDGRIRGQASTRSRNGQPVHNLTSLGMTSKHADDKPVLLEAMRANGFASARMVRARLLHKFLWSYVSNLPSWHGAVNSNQCSYDLKSPSTCQLFALDEAIKTMPLELFLQVVGSPKEIENMVERCKLGLRLSDISISEYKSLFDSRATCRLSNIINILVRMKLIRVVKEGTAEDDNGLSHAVLTYAMELKPYIEEPMTRTITPSHFKVDLRPRIRHDFLLLKPEAVDVYWETLEYCYAAADQVAASCAFPGSSVCDVFHTRSWTSVRVMNTEQRIELLKRVNNVDPRKKISFKDCIRIARELDLTVEQVLRVSYDKRQYRLYRYSSSSKSSEKDNHTDGDNCRPFNSKRKRSSKDGSPEYDLEQNESLRTGKPKICHSTGVDDQSTETNLLPTGDHDDIKHAADSDMHVEDGRNSAFINCAFPRKKPMRAKRFFWTDTLDRRLVVQYARHRAMLGARFYRVDWTSLSDLPALPSTCARRMAVLNANIHIRRSIMRLCNLLGERYATYLEKIRIMKEPVTTQNLSLTHDESISELNCQQYFWDNFEDPDVRIAVDEVLRCKRSATFQYAKRLGSRQGKEWPDIPPIEGKNSDIQQFSQSAKDQNIISECDGNESQKLILRHKRVNVLSTRPSRLRSHHSRRNLVKIWNSRYIFMKRKVYESLAVANAVELLKLVFLSTSATTEVQSSLVATLQLYSEHDIFAAFNYLKEKNFMENLECSSYDKNGQGLSSEEIGAGLHGNLMCQNYGSVTAVVDEVRWDAIANHAECLSAVQLDGNKATTFSPEFFKSVHSAVCQAGEQGLNMKELSVAMDIQGGQFTEVVVDTMELFQLVIKVNSFDNERIVDSSYKSKYLLRSPGAQTPDHSMSSDMKSRMTSYGASQQNFEKKVDITYDSQKSNVDVCDGHKMTIIDLPSESVILDVEGQDNISIATLPKESMVVRDSDQGKEVNYTAGSETHPSRPILPWINVDGSTNTIVYKGLTRRLLGTVMQYPGILEEDIIRRMDVLNPQSCRRLLELMVLDNHLTVRILHQTRNLVPGAHSKRNVVSVILADIDMSGHSGPMIATWNHPSAPILGGSIRTFSTVDGEAPVAAELTVVCLLSVPCPSSHVGEVLLGGPRESMLNSEFDTDTCNSTLVPEKAALSVRMAADHNLNFNHGRGFSQSFSNQNVVPFQSEVVNSATELMSGGMHSSGEISGMAGMIMPRSLGTQSNTSSMMSLPGKSSGNIILESAHPLKHSPALGARWSFEELIVLKQCLVAYANEPNIMKYIKIAARLPDKTVRDVAMRCQLMTKKEIGKRRKLEDYHADKKVKDSKEKMAYSSSVASANSVRSDNMTTYSFPMLDVHCNNQLLLKASPINIETQRLLIENVTLLSQIGSNLEMSKVHDNVNLFYRTRDNIRTILNSISSMPGIMSQMPSLPVSIDDNLFQSICPLIGQVYVPGSSHLKEEPRFW
ncbi:hypothetical protein MUK42_27492 [Musa troglodytarum]|uniref:B-block binding subunit of TFIIIC domain-containing protein n=1 Tax=Musa troglodytarum TaxID=320322 RepID=A0A9E7F2C1_9LILI|nr:hypothetical protein MUK42_27492 [Musa troglodytarum]